MATDAVHDRLLAIATSLPEAVEDHPWGGTHCKVRGKIFCGWGRDDDGVMHVTFKTGKELRDVLVSSDPRFAVAAYVGKHGWVTLRMGARPRWGEVERLISDSYQMIAPKKLTAKLDATTAPRAIARPAKSGRKSKRRT